MMFVLSEMRVAVCGDLPTACGALKKEGVSHVDSFTDGIELWVKLRRNEPYHLVLIHSQSGAGMTGLCCSCKTQMEGEWSTVPVMLVSEPACPGELDSVRAALRSIAREMEAAG